MSASRIKKLSVLAFLFLFPILSHAQVAGISFTTQPQTIAPNNLSQAITIQTQDSSGNSSKTPETIDLNFQSTSPTGQFLGSTGNPVTKTMSTNTSNRTFYYEDSTEGDFTLTVSATGRTSGNKWSASQQITVSNSSSNSTTTSNNSNSSQDSSQTSQDNNSSSLSPSYSSAPITSEEDAVNFKIGAGRDRLASVDSPIEFKSSQNSSNMGRTIITWNFGDGSIAYGPVVEHSYSYPGDYAVVVNGNSPDGQAISRVNVRVVPDTLKITEASPERIEIYNNGKYEINLFGKKLVASGKSFVFPQDTIIQAGEKISFSSSVTNLVPTDPSEASLVPLNAKTHTTSSNNSTAVDSLLSQILSLQRKEIALKNQTQSSDNLQMADVVMALDSSTSSATTTPSIPHRGWFQTIKKFFGFK